LYYDLYYKRGTGLGENEDMAISVRLDGETQSALEKAAKIIGTSKSEVGKKSVKLFCNKVLTERTLSPYELIRDLIPYEGSNKGDISARGEEILRERLGRK
jgi:hypothetical protein